MAVELISELKKASALNGDKILEAVRELVSSMASKEITIVSGKNCFLKHFSTPISTSYPITPRNQKFNEFL